MMRNDEVLTISEMCVRLKTSASTLYRRRRDGNGPPFFKEGRNIRYHWPTVMKWLHEVTTDGYTD